MKHRLRAPIVIVVLAAVAAVAVTALLVNIFTRQQEALNPFYRVVELNDETVDPAVWGKNFPLQYDGYRRTVDQVRTRYGGSEAVPRTPTQADPRGIVAQSRLEEDPRLRTMWAGYAFAQDFREERGHAFMLERSEEHTSELQSRLHLVCRLLLEKKKQSPQKTRPPTSAPQPTPRTSGPQTNRYRLTR